jgi:hypothetical protein
VNIDVWKTIQVIFENVAKVFNGFASILLPSEVELSFWVWGIIILGIMVIIAGIIALIKHLKYQ